MYIFIALSAVLVTVAFGESCTNPKVNTKTFTSKNTALSTETSFVAEFTVSCESQDLYAELQTGVLVPVAYTEESNTYQISWAKDHKAAPSGTVAVKIFNDEGSTMYRKAQRNGEDVSKLNAFFTVSISHPGAGREGLFVQTEFIAVVVALLIWWSANSMRSQIME